MTKKKEEAKPKVIELGDTHPYPTLPSEVKQSACPVCGTVGVGPVCVVDGFDRGPK